MSNRLTDLLTAIQDLQAKGGYNRGVFATNTAYKKYDIVINNGFIYYAASAFTSTTGFLSANWTFLGAIITADQAASLKAYTVSYDKIYGFDTASSAFGYVNTIGDICGVKLNGYSNLTSSITINYIMLLQGQSNQLRFNNSVILTIGNGARSSQFNYCNITLNTDCKIIINSVGVESTATSFDSTIVGGSNSSVEVPSGCLLALRGGSSIHKITGSGTIYLYDHSRVIAADSTITIIDRRTTNTPPNAAIKNAVKASINTWTSGELQGTQPAGSEVGMRFVDANYRYEYMSGQYDINGTTYVWCRTVKS
jgi:hypothetical protein